MQVGALQLAWAFFTFFTELQGNLTAGRYKRVMTWVVNFPTFVFMIGNVIISVLRDNNGVQDGIAWDICFAVVFCVLALVNTANYATHAMYKHHRWAVVTDGKCSDDEPTQRQLPASCMANRFVPMGLLNIVTIGCLIFLTFVGLIGFNNDMGHLLTDTWVAEPSPSDVRALV